MGYAAINHVLQPMVCWNVTAMLEDAGYESVPITNNFPWCNANGSGQDPSLNGMPNYNKSLPVEEGKAAPDVFVHMRIAAFMAGLGEIGWSKMPAPGRDPHRRATRTRPDLRGPDAVRPLHDVRAAMYRWRDTHRQVREGHRRGP
jgi:hypothetical protein